MRALNSWVRCAFDNIFVFCVILYFDQDQERHLFAFCVFLNFEQNQDEIFLYFEYCCILKTKMDMAKSVEQGKRMEERRKGERVSLNKFSWQKLL